MRAVVIAKEGEDVVCAGGNAPLALADGLGGCRRSAGSGRRGGRSAPLGLRGARATGGLMAGARGGGEARAGPPGLAEELVELGQTVGSGGPAAAREGRGAPGMGGDCARPGPASALR